MKHIHRKKQNKLLASIISLLAVAFVVNPLFETNPQSCGMISGIEKRNRKTQVK